MATAYYLTYNSGHGVWAFTGYEGTPFLCTKDPVVFADKKEARKALAYVRENYAPWRKHFVARQFRIVETDKDCSYIGNVK